MTWLAAEHCSVHPARPAEIGYSYQIEEFFFPEDPPLDDPDSLPSELCCGDCALCRHGVRISSSDQVVG